ncbi:MAG: 2-hydroxychromene-2-carboxylate isomerase [Alphaproteobacteria bacterium]
MTKTVDYYMSPTSPWTYLGHARFAEIAKAAGATVMIKPINVGEVFAVTGGLPLGKRHPARQAYRLVELERWRTHLDVPLTMHPKFFPANDEPARRLIEAARQAGADAMGLAHALLRAVWAEERDIADHDTLAAILGENGLSADLFAAADGQAVTDEIAASTAQAIERNVIGVPNYYVDGKPHWGQDRLDFVQRALKG